MQLIIGISGFVGSGKTTVSEWFIGNHGFRRFSFADPIREMLMVLGVDEATLRDPVKKEEPHPALMGQTPRFAMEELGTTWGRDIMHPHFWLGQFALRTKKARLVIVDDVRFQNEADAIRGVGGKVFKLIVPGREPRVKTDYAVQRLVPDEALSNDMDNGVTTKTLYEYIYGRMFGKTNIQPPGMKLDVWSGIPAQARAEIMAQRAAAEMPRPDPVLFPRGGVMSGGFPSARDTMERAQDASPAPGKHLGR